MPIGNGRLGAMVFGGVGEEKIQLNEDTLWTGAPHDYNHPGASDHLAQIRKLIAEQNYDEALKLGDEKMLGIPPNQASYQPLGDLQMRFADHQNETDYRRELDIQNSVARVSYRIGSVRYTREVFISYPDQIMAMQLTCDQPSRLGIELEFSCPHSNQITTLPDGRLCLVGEVQTGYFDGEKHGTRFAAEVRVCNEGGTVSAGKRTLSVKDADSVTLLYSAATSYRNYKDISGDPNAICLKHLDAAARASWDELLKTHVDDVRTLFNRVDIDLGGGEGANRATDERVAAVRKGATDRLLVAQSFQFGRYLIIAGSRPGSQPLNLQGIWNDTTTPPWGSKWTLNCNVEINYWPVEICNLSECHEPLLRMIEELREPGRVTAKTNYNCRGWVAHHNTDIWRGTAIVDGFTWGIWPAAGAWLCRHLWEHYAFTGDETCLARAYPTMKEAVEFFEDFLIPDENGRLVTTPSISFEQAFRTLDGKIGRLCAGPTMDMQILRDLFSNCIAASEILAIDAEYRVKLTDIRDRLVPTQISPRTGQIQEWCEDWDPETLDSGQLAPLWGLFPGREIRPRDTPELAESAAKTMAARDPMFGSWCSATRLNFAARLGDGSLAGEMLVRHLRDHVMPSLLSNFGENQFEIDGNLGVTAGIAEMLIQSHGDVIELLPALPAAWPTGKFTGLRARGGFIVDVEWKDGKVTAYRVAGEKPGPVKVRVNGTVQTVSAEDKSLDGLNF